MPCRLRRRCLEAARSDRLWCRRARRNQYAIEGGKRLRHPRL